MVKTEQCARISGDSAQQPKTGQYVFIALGEIERRFCRGSP
jgi:hypothetical protein